MAPLESDPEQLELALRAVLGRDLPPDWHGRRQALEALAAHSPPPDLDPLLLATRELELAASTLELGFAGHRPVRLLATDPVTATFEVRDGDGAAWALRLLKPAWRRDPVWRRRLERAPLPQHPALLGPGELLEESGVLARRVALPGPGLDMLLPGDTELGELLARGLTRCLSALTALHQQGLRAGPLSSHLLRLGPEGPQLLWLDPVLGAPRSPAEDLAGLGRVLSLLCTDPPDNLSALTLALAENPPPNTTIAESLLRDTLSSQLAERRHRLARRARALDDSSRINRLYALARRLAHTPAPQGVFCLKAGPDSSAWYVRSDADGVVGGQALDWPARQLPQVWSAEQGLDPVNARALGRAWAGRLSADEARRASIQDQLGAADEGAEALVRWLNAQARLRTLLRLMQHVV